MNIGITGADGLIGWHLRASLRARGGHEARLATRDTFSDPARLAAFVEGLDGVVHLAGMNRGDESDVERVNVELARALVGAFERTGAAPRVAFANSTHVDRDTGYGRGKREAAAHLKAWADRTGARFANLVFPHIFGEFGRPFYNSVVSTFCHQLAEGSKPEILIDGHLELLHVQEVASRCVLALEAEENGDFRIVGAPTQVSALLERLNGMMSSYGGGVIPDLREPLDLRLFNTLRSYLFPKHYPVPLTLHTDDRGSLFEAVKTGNGGQTFLSTTRPGITRGNHFHTRKVERFLVVSGEADIHLRKMFTDDVISFRVNGARPSYVDMPTFYTHSLVNVGDTQLVTLFWSNEIFDPADSDTYPEPVLKS
jgi:UDP-2-acetamido-2,6-beta-L-arabino-hexul-4-ose reductase